MSSSAFICCGVLRFSTLPVGAETSSLFSRRSMSLAMYTQTSQMQAPVGPCSMPSASFIGLPQNAQIFSSSSIRKISL